MSNKTILIGSHVSYKSKNYLIDSVNETISYNANCFMIYTGPPQNFIRKDIEPSNVKQANEIMKNHNIDHNNIVVHAPYLINLCSSNKETRDLSIIKLTDELNRTKQLGSHLLVLHPGSYVKGDIDSAIEMIANGINKAFENAKNNVIICLETMAGKGTEVGRNFDELKRIMDLVNEKSRIGVCIDTCHIHEAGYQIDDIDGILNEFDNKIGLSKLKVIHLNDSKNEKGAKKDRHENIGLGKIGFKTLTRWVHHDKIVGIPTILETPYLNDKPIYKQEISNLLSKEWNNYDK